jgi:hypothetical protein
VSGLALLRLLLLVLVKVQRVLRLVEQALVRLGLVLAVTAKLVTVFIAGAAAAGVEVFMMVGAQRRLGDDFFRPFVLVGGYGVQTWRVDIAGATSLDIVLVATVAFKLNREQRTPP